MLADLQVAGGGDFTITASTLTGSTLSGGGGNIHSDSTTLGGFGARIEYSYEYSNIPVPEPNSLFLVGSLPLFMFLRRRR